MRLRAAVGLGVAIAAVAAAGALAAPADPPYSKRLQILEALAVRYPGAVERGSPLGKYGLWAGILVQTTWQKTSGRDRIPLWSLVNRHLSVEPSTYAALLQRSGPGGDPQTLCRSARSAEVCRAWLAYLIGAKRRLPAPTLLRLLWHAHTTAIVHALQEDRSLLAHARTTRLERNFWASWVEIVFLLEAARFPTDAATSLRASKLLMPPCSPLGAPGCTLTAADLGRAFPFVSALALHRASVDRALSEYRTLRKPGSLATLALADPSLALALRFYLAVAR